MENMGQPSGSGQIVWTNTMSSMMLSFLDDLVATGTRTSSGFKAMHLNNCVKALNEHFKTGITGAQISNHLKKWINVWINVTKLQNLSGALWDEDTSTIRLADDHYANHVKDHKGDASYLNTPIEHYNAMATIFGASMATSKYAKSGNDSIAVEVLDVEDDQDIPNGSGTEVNMSHNMGESANANAGESSHNKQPPRKKAKVEAKDEDPMFPQSSLALKGLLQLSRRVLVVVMKYQKVFGMRWTAFLDLRRAILFTIMLILWIIHRLQGLLSRLAFLTS